MSSPPGSWRASGSRPATPPPRGRAPPRRTPGGRAPDGRAPGGAPGGRRRGRSPRHRPEAGHHLWQVEGRPDPRGRPAEHRDRVHGAVGRVAGGGLRHPFQGDGQADLHVERAVARNRNPPATLTRSQSASMSVEQYQVAAEARRSRPSRRPDTVIRWAATVPAATARPRSTVPGRHGHRTRRLDRVQRQSHRLGEQAERGAEGGGAVGPAAGVEAGRILAETHQTKNRSGEFRLDRSANSSMGRRSSRRWMEVRTIGSASEMNPGLIPVLWIEVAPGRARCLHPGRAGRVHACRVMELAAGGHDVRTGGEQRADGVEVHTLLHVEDAVGPSARIVADVPRRPHPVGPSPQSSPASRPSFSGECTWTPTRVPGDARSRPSASGCRCCRWPIAPPVVDGGRRSFMVLSGVGDTSGAGAARPRFSRSVVTGIAVPEDARR